MDTARLLEEAVARITALERSRTVREDEVTEAFKVLQRAVTRACRSRAAPPEELLAGLQPKPTLLRFVVEVHRRRRIHRRQTVAILDTLLRIGLWRAAWAEDHCLQAELPSDLREALAGGPREPLMSPPPTPPLGFRSVPAGAPAATSTAANSPRGDWAMLLRKEPPAPFAPRAAHTRPVPPVPTVAVPSRAPSPALAATAPAVPVPWGTDAARTDADVAPESLATPWPDPGTAAEAASPPRSRSAQLLTESLELMEGLRFRASGGGGDEVSKAFELLTRALRIAQQSGSLCDVEDIECFEPKAQVLAFLADFHERRRSHRSRLGSVLGQLMCFGSWRVAADEDPVMRLLLRRDSSSAPPEVQQASDLVKTAIVREEARKRLEEQVAAHAPWYLRMFVPVLGAMGVLRTCRCLVPKHLRECTEALLDQASTGA